MGVPLALLEYVPGDDVQQLRQLPRDLLVAGLGGFAVGALAGVASQLTGQRVNFLASTIWYSASRSHITSRTSTSCSQISIAI